MPEVIRRTFSDSHLLQLRQGSITAVDGLFSLPKSSVGDSAAPISSGLLASPAGIQDIVRGRASQDGYDKSKSAIVVPQVSVADGPSLGKHRLWQYLRPQATTAIFADAPVSAPCAAVSLPYGGHLAFVQANAFKDILRNGAIGPHTCIIFDIDSTLMWRGTGWLGAVEHEAIQLVRSFQDIGIPVFGLTARQPSESARICKNLARIGFNLARTSPIKAAAAFNTPEPSLYENGIVYSGSNPKGDLLEVIHKQTSLGHVICVDDRVGNFWSLVLAARRCQLDFTACYYTRAMSKSAVARNADEWHYLQSRQNDDAALQRQALRYQKRTPSRNLYFDGPRELRTMRHPPLSLAQPRQRPMVAPPKKPADEGPRSHRTALTNVAEGVARKCRKAWQHRPDSVIWD